MTLHQFHRHHQRLAQVHKHRMQTHVKHEPSGISPNIVYKDASGRPLSIPKRVPYASNTGSGGKVQKISRRRQMRALSKARMALQNQNRFVFTHHTRASATKATTATAAARAYKTKFGVSGVYPEMRLPIGKYNYFHTLGKLIPKPPNTGIGAKVTTADFQSLIMTNIALYAGFRQAMIVINRVLRKHPFLAAIVLGTLNGVAADTFTQMKIEGKKSTQLDILRMVEFGIYSMYVSGAGYFLVIILFKLYLIFFFFVFSRFLLVCN